MKNDSPKSSQHVCFAKIVVQDISAGLKWDFFLFLEKSKGYQNTHFELIFKIVTTAVRKYAIKRTSTKN